MRSARERESLATVQDARRSCKLRKRCYPQLDVREPHGVIVPVLLLAVTVTPELFFFARFDLSAAIRDTSVKSDAAVDRATFKVASVCGVLRRS